jgi:hypothetical protein
MEVWGGQICGETNIKCQQLLYLISGLNSQNIIFKLNVRLFKFDALPSCPPPVLHSNELEYITLFPEAVYEAIIFVPYYRLKKKWGNYTNNYNT